MSVTKFRDTEQARIALWTNSRDKDLPRRIAQLWATASRLCPAWKTEGVRRFKTIEDANEHRRLAVVSRVRLLRKQRGHG